MISIIHHSVFEIHHVIARNNIFSFLLLSTTFHYMDIHSIFIHSSIDRQCSHSQFEAIMNTTAMIIHVWFICGHMVSSVWGKNGIAWITP